MNKKIVWCGVVIFCSLFFTSCLSMMLGEPSNDAVRDQTTKVYTASGDDESLLKAINKAKISAIQKAVVDLIGVYAEQQHEARLRETLYGTKNPNAFVVNEAMEVLNKYMLAGNYFCEIKIPVRMRVISDFLNAQGITAGNTAAKNENQNQLDTRKENFVPENKKNPDDVLAQEKKRAEEAGNAEYLAHYLNTMTYMVYGAENSSADPFLLKSAVEMANAYLIQQGNTVIDFAEVEKLKKESAQLYQESQASGISLIQWIAQRLNADVYLEVDAATEGGWEYDSYYGSAKITVKIFNPSTGEILGSVPYSSPKTFSRISAYDAESNALQSTVYKVLPIVSDQSKLMLARAYARGIRYEITLNGSKDTRLMTLFRKELAKEVNDIRTINLSSAQARYAVFAFCELDEILSIVYNIAEKLPGFENMELVVLRGKSLTFSMGR